MPWGLDTIQWPSADEWVAIFTCVLAVSTILLWDATRRLLKASERQGRDFLRSVVAAEDGAKAAAAAVEAAAEANRIFREAFWVDQRPWISIEDVRITSPLVFDPAGAIRLSVEFKLYNSGRTPAEAVEAEPVLFISFPDQPHSALAEILQRKHPGWGGTTFNAGERRPIAANAYLGPADMEAWRERYRLNWPDALDIRHMSLCLLGTISYRAPVGGERHNTTFVLDVFYQTQGMSIPLGIGDIPASDLILSRHIQGDVAHR